MLLIYLMPVELDLCCLADLPVDVKVIIQEVLDVIQPNALEGNGTQVVLRSVERGLNT